jgi:hypothetical protein
VVGLAGESPVEILDDDGHTGERTARPAARFLACALETLVDDRVEHRVAALGAVDGGVDELECAHRAGAHRRRLRDRVSVGEIAHTANRITSSDAAGS